jgi:5S rRNA maturation endonuclease (ribonuclease M5)
MRSGSEQLIELLREKQCVSTIVEGKKDVAALRALGFTSVLELERQPLFKVVEHFEKGSTVQILTDLDAEGRKLFAKLRADLTQRGVRIDNDLREALFRTELRQIEGIVTYLYDVANS